MKGIEITDPSTTEDDISEVWAEGLVTYMGEPIIRAYEKDCIYEQKDCIYEHLYDPTWDACPPGEGQEVYLGYDRDSDTFIMGYDWWSDDEDHMVAPILKFRVEGRDPKDVTLIDVMSGCFYPNAHARVKRQFKNILDLRLD